MTTGRRRRKKSGAAAGQGGDGGVADYRRELWGMEDALRGSMDAAEYKHVVLGLIFLKYRYDKNIRDSQNPDCPARCTAAEAGVGQDTNTGFK